MNLIFLAILLPVLYLTGQLFIRFRNHRIHLRSAGWPMVLANVKKADIGQQRGGGQGEHVTFKLKIEFSYVVIGREHCGSYAKDFSLAGEAVTLLRSVEKGPFYIRYNPASTADYVADPYRDIPKENV